MRVGNATPAAPDNSTAACRNGPGQNGAQKRHKDGLSGSKIGILVAGGIGHRATLLLLAPRQQGAQLRAGSHYPLIFVACVGSREVGPAWWHRRLAGGRAQGAGRGMREAPPAPVRAVGSPDHATTKSRVILGRPVGKRPPLAADKDAAAGSVVLPAPPAIGHGRLAMLAATFAHLPHVRICAGNACAARAYRALTIGGGILLANPPPLLAVFECGPHCAPRCENTRMPRLLQRRRC